MAPFDLAPFDLKGPLPTGRTVLEASAGTGKTYSLTGLIVRYIAEAATLVDQFLVVTFTRAAANELRERTRHALDLAATAFRSGTAPAEHPWMSVLFDVAALPTTTDPSIELERRERRLVEAVARFDELTITTIHGFCQQALAQLGVRSGNNPDAVLVESLNDLVVEVCRDAIITVLADDPRALDTPSSSWTNVRNPQQAEKELVAAVTALMSNPGAVIAPKDATDQIATRWVDLATTTQDTLVARQAARNEIGYDTLISGLQRALADPEHGVIVAGQLAQRSSVILVDEFQDTDRLQWDLFHRAFAQRTLITVGDPKQAIYRFRGADVHAYLDAVQASTALSLTTNHRSDAAVLDGLAQLLDGATLGDARIPFRAVEARPGAPVSAFGTTRPEPGVAHPAVHLRAVPPADALRTKATNEISMPLVRTLVLGDLVTRIIDLLDHGTLAVAVDDQGAADDQDAGDDQSDDDGDTAGGRTVRPVVPGDIAVLVPSHAEANNVAAALRRARIPAVRTRTGSVLLAPAATQWRLLLAALAQPHQTPVVRAAALGWFLHTDIATIVGDDEALADLQATAATLADRMRTVGVSAFYDEQKAQHLGLVATVLGREGGERHLTDLDHIAELLAAESHGRPADPAQVLRTLDQLIIETDERNEAAMRRIDSDALAVQVTTIHAAKGLEYPIVLLPFAFKMRGNVRTPHSYTTPDGQRTLDLASKVAWDGGPSTPGDETTRDNQELRRQLTINDIEGDELRLLYVALTRAKHRVEIWWASTRGAGTSALGRILTDRYGAGPVQNSPYPWKPKSKGRLGIGRPLHQSMTDIDVLAQIQHLVAGSDGTLALSVLPETIEPPRWSGRTVPPSAPLRAARSERATVGDPRWTRWSFSRLTAAVAASGSEPAEAAALDRTAALDVRGTGDRGGFDEPGDVLDPDATDVPGAAVEQLQLGIGPVAHLANVVGGTQFGTFVHAVLEHLDCTAADLPSEVLALVVEHAAREGLDLAALERRGAGRDAIVAGIVAAVRTPLGPLFSGRALADISPRDRLAELVFDLPIAGSVGAFSSGAIGQVLLTHLDRHDPVRPFARRLATDFAGFDIAGWMHGSIDGVFRVPDGGTHRYIVVDYKTNRLHEPGAADPVAAYHPRQLIGAMEHSRYPLQALLYTVALHRYLRWRLGSGYDPDRHLGGIAYLFVRGMVGPQTPTVDDVPHGVFSWLPPVSAIVALDQLFAAGRP
ncbi:MAG: Exodeoxyribonuclease [Acidimicrobiales bacterium]|nr:Exodeoxyribonuclease [Acidimicrobiales bacterium]